MKRPARATDDLRPKIGIAAVLAQSDRVVRAFGRWPGFALMVLAIAACAGVSGTAVLLIGKLFTH
jgi:hypothetical protein